MKTLIFFMFTLSLSLQAQTSSDASKKKNQLDYGDKQLFGRDVCRRPIEWLQTRYPDYSKEELQKMKDKCSY